jgi:hypothetical protein
VEEGFRFLGAFGDVAEKANDTEVGVRKFDTLDGPFVDFFDAGVFAFGGDVGCLIGVAGGEGVAEALDDV